MTQVLQHVSEALAGKQHVCMLCDLPHAYLSDLFYHVFEDHLVEASGYIPSRSRHCWCGELIGGPFSFRTHMDGGLMSNDFWGPPSRIWEHFLEATCGGAAHG
jgi:hypothetical protein